MKPSQPILRFAPSPNGRLHLGHAYCALLNDQIAKDLGGTMLLRIEDIDVARCKPEFDRAIIDDLHWLGLVWPEPVLRQSERFAAYGTAAELLKADGLLYPCFCTRGVVGADSDGLDPDGAPRYGGRCRNLSPAEIAGRFGRGEVAQWRLKMDISLEKITQLQHYETGFIGYSSAYVRFSGGIVPITPPARPQDWGDVVIVRKQVPGSYHLSVVVDDGAQGVTHVVRGRDLLASTDVHRVLQSLLGLPTPHYLHHGLITDDGDHKLAKSRGSRSLMDLRAEGWSVGDVMRRLGFA